MKRINKKLLEALDKLIAKYSGEEIETSGYMNCPLCDMYYHRPNSKYDRSCKGCPNMFFSLKICQNSSIGCDDRKMTYPKLVYLNKENYPILKQFWTDYKSLYLQRKYSNSEIMEILIVPFKEEKK